MTSMIKRKQRGVPLEKSEKLTIAIAYVALTLFGLMALLPCLHVISKAFSLGSRVTAGQVYFWPNGFQLETVDYVLTETSFFTSLKNSLIVFVAGTAFRCSPPSPPPTRFRSRPSRGARS